MILRNMFFYAVQDFVIAIPPIRAGVIAMYSNQKGVIAVIAVCYCSIQGCNARCALPAINGRT